MMYHIVLYYTIIYYIILYYNLLYCIITYHMIQDHVVLTLPVRLVLSVRQAAATPLGKALLESLEKRRSATISYIYLYICIRIRTPRH